MKQIIVSLVVLLMSLSAWTQNYKVASVTGDVSCLRAGVKSLLAPRENLTPKDIIHIGERSSLSVIDRDANRIYVLKSQSDAMLADLLKKQNRSYTKKFSSNTLDALGRGDTENISHVGNVVYKDLAADNKIYSAIKATSYTSSYAISMLIIDSQTGKEIETTADIGQTFFFRITNSASEPLFVNVLDIASDGSMYDCLPIDKGGTMLHLLIPALATVDLMQYPMEFAEPKGVDELILIAYNKPFDIRRVIQLCKNSEPAAAKAEGVGIYRINVNVK